MQLVKSNPFRDTQKLIKDMNKSWDKDLEHAIESSEATALDLYEENGKLYAQMSLPNFNKEDIKVKTLDGILEISANHKEDDEIKNNRSYYFKEFNNSYSRTVRLPEGANTDLAKANYEEGMLTISMPIKASPKAKELSIG